MKNFESTFPNNYRRDEVKQILNSVLTGKFCQIVCVPGAGKATVLRLLAHNRSLLRFHLGEKEKSTRILYFNLLELTNYEQEQIAKLLLFTLNEKVTGSGDYLVLTKKLSEAVSKLVFQKQTLIFLFDHFDEYQNQLPRSFFHLLRKLRSIAKYQFAAAFATRRDLIELLDPEILKDFYDFFIGNTIYLQVRNNSATSFLFSQIEGVFKKKLSQADKKNILSVSGGHIKLTKVLTEIALREAIVFDKETLLKTPIVKATLLEIWLALTAQEQQTLRSITQNEEPAKETLENLLRFDLIQKSGHQYIFTIPLLKELILTAIPTQLQEKLTFDEKTKEIMKGTNIISDLLSPQEYRLLRFLIVSQGHIIHRDEIVKAVWPDALVLEGISDEAIDQLVYRLRKKTENDPNNPRHLQTIKGQGFRFQP
ncbi:hypothetical protein A2165_00275 [Candidatus Curtissbacteria bacterium RBG_13_40_7]|uniref:OmpR/PhoB-type domain-containing protein n=1 Tax=Candidatus Curtissbacteria bacterium RBG_13_40_7 TaxID=1797706 RepID=A0A1F5FWB9_9BACT|nr:MAG: hypothetical protein A2165_00275 [Candidatus Curtissbacteria bacterium RBG_13_40_7]